MPANYDFVIGNFTVTEGGGTIISDNFSSAPGTPNYTTNGSTFSAGGEITGTSAGPLFVGVRLRPLVGQQAVLNESLSFDQSFNVSGTFDLVIPTAANQGYGIGLTDDTPIQLGTETVLLGIYDDNGTPVIDLVEINDRTGATNVLASIPLADINTTGANEIAFSLDYVPPQNASDNSPSAEPVTASFQLLYNGVDVGSAQTMADHGDHFRFVGRFHHPVLRR